MLDTRIKIERDPYRGDPPTNARYHFHDMSVGDKMTIPAGNEHPAKVRFRVDCAMRNWRNRTGLKHYRFVFKYDDQNVYLYRLPDSGTALINITPKEETT